MRLASPIAEFDPASMKRLTSLVLLCLALLTCAVAAQAPASSAEDQQLLTALKQVQEQQTQLAANQAAIEAKLATIAETIRQARIYSSRAGKRDGSP